MLRLPFLVNAHLVGRFGHGGGGRGIDEFITKAAHRGRRDAIYFGDVEQRPVAPRASSCEREVFRKFDNERVVTPKHDVEPSAAQLATRRHNASPAKKFGVARLCGAKDHSHENHYQMRP